MDTKKLIWIGMFIGSTVAGFIPSLWGSAFLSITGLVFSGAGAFLGIWAGYKVGNAI